ncbi:MAG TPA: flagellar M-ring protein FliF, partial [Arcobacter sp.]|nr:flagellar M-ring protein FliF [Arcobacter sp.]
ESLNGIISASVKIARPKESVFTQKKTDPSASAVLSLRQGVALTQKQIEGIKSFIASAVPKLNPENIKLIDQNGALLEKDQEAIDNLKYISHEKYKKKIETDYEDKIITLLSPFIGSDRVVARVTVALDFRNQLIEQEIFEPEGTIRSQQTTESTSTKEEKEQQTGAVPGVQSNIQNPNEEDGATKSKAASEEAKNIVNYEISKKIIKQKDNSFAKVEKIKAAVTFDSTILEKVENKEEFLNKLKSIVEDGIGVDIQRGDKVSVEPFKFLVSDINGTANGLEGADGSLGSLAAKSFLQEYGEYLQYIISALLLLIFYKKFIAKNDIVLATTGEATKEQVGVADEDFDYEPFNPSVEQNKLKSKVRNQILTNIDGMDQETAAKYEVLVEELDNKINNHPDEIAKMIELLLSEGDMKLKAKKEN